MYDVQTLIAFLETAQLPANRVGDRYYILERAAIPDFFALLRKIEQMNALLFWLNDNTTQRHEIYCIRKA